LARRAYAAARNPFAAPRQIRKGHLANRPHTAAHSPAERWVGVASVKNRIEQAHAHDDGADVSRIGFGAWHLVACGRKGTTARGHFLRDADPGASGATRQVDCDPFFLGTFEREGVIDGYVATYTYSIAADESYRLDTVLEETGTSQAGGGKYRTMGAKTGRIRTGSYRIGATTIGVTNANGTAVFQPVQPGGPIDQVNPIMLGIWRATIVQGGQTWTWTIQNNSDGT
jgi:hypothetical protein